MYLLSNSKCAFAYSESIENTLGFHPLPSKDLNNHRADKCIATGPQDAEKPKSPNIRISK